MPSRRVYRSYLSASINRKGVLDIDTVKGCEFGMNKYPDGGCYGLCYAYKMSELYGYDFSKSIVRKVIDRKSIERTLKKHPLSWFRIGTMGDPSYDWDNTADVCEWLSKFKIPVIITKHWVKMSCDHAKSFLKNNVTINTSISPLDTQEEIEHRLYIFKWLKDIGINSILRIVSAKFGNTENGNNLKQKQNQIFNNYPIIDNPLRIPEKDKRVLCGDIITERHKDLGGGSTISISKSNTYIGPCKT